MIESNESVYFGQESIYAKFHKGTIIDLERQLLVRVILLESRQTPPLDILLEWV